MEGLLRADHAGVGKLPHDKGIPGHQVRTHAAVAVSEHGHRAVGREDQGIAGRVIGHDGRIVGVPDLQESPHRPGDGRVAYETQALVAPDIVIEGHGGESPVVNGKGHDDGLLVGTVLTAGQRDPHLPREAVIPGPCLDDGRSVVQEVGEQLGLPVLGELQAHQASRAVRRGNLCPEYAPGPLGYDRADLVFLPPEP